MGATVEKFFGICQACGGEFHVLQGAIVLHGYKRPGIGHTLGRCPGSHQPPYEVTCDFTKHLVAQTRERLVELARVLEEMRHDRTRSYHVEGTEKIGTNPLNGRAIYNQVLVRPGEPKWERARERAMREVESTMALARGNIDFWQGMIAKWRPTTVRSFHERQARDEQVKVERAVARGNALDQKREKLVESLRRRVDSGIRTAETEYKKAKKQGTLESLWVQTSLQHTAARKLYELLTEGIKKIRDEGKYETLAEATTALDRPAEVRALGLADESNQLVLVRKDHEFRGQVHHYLVFRAFHAGQEWVERGTARYAIPGPVETRAIEGLKALFQSR